MRTLFVAAFAALLVATAPLAAEEHSHRKTSSAKKDKKPIGATCKAPAVGACASCAIECRPGETATCGPGMISADLCARPPTCTCK